MSFQTDFPNVPPCDRNNCRCGDNKNCMYYNSAGPGQAHYNYVAVQGSGDPMDAAYGCASRAYDVFNAGEMYDDYAVGPLGTYAEVSGTNQNAGPVHYSAEIEKQFGRRDMCDNSKFYGPFSLPYKYPSPNMYNTGYPLIHLTILAFLVYGFYSGYLRLNKRSTIMLLVALSLAYIYFHF